MLSFDGCDTRKDVSETPNTMSPSIMADGELYSTTEGEMPIEPY